MGLRDTADGIGVVMQQGNLIMLPFALVDGGIITQLIGLGITTTGVSIRLAVRLCNTCESFYDGLRGKLHGKFCRDKFCTRCFDSMVEKARGNGYYFTS